MAGIQEQIATAMIPRKNIVEAIRFLARAIQDGEVAGLCEHVEAIFTQE